MILIYRHSTLQFISWKWKYLCLILRRERACLSLQRTRKGHHFQGYYHLISNSISGLFIGKFGRYRILQRGAVKIFGTLLPRPRTCEAKIIFTFPILILEKKKNSERRDALKHAFLPVLQQKADIIPALHTHMHVCIFMFCNMPFLYQIIHPSIKTLQTGSK